MLRSRIVPFLLLDRGQFVKTRRFSEPKYVGDPLNTVRIFNEKEVDEISILDVSASPRALGPDFKLLSKLAGESRMPLAYCGGITKIDEVVKLISLGVEKVGVGSTFLHNPELVSDSARIVGRQSIYVVLNYTTDTGSFANPKIYDCVGSKPTQKDLREMALFAESLGAGEIVLSAVDRDGTMEGYDLELAESIRSSVGIPITIVGGAGNLQDFSLASDRLGPIGLGAGSIFVFTGKFRSVLIQYPSLQDRQTIYATRQGSNS